MDNIGKAEEATDTNYYESPNEPPGYMTEKTQSRGFFGDFVDSFKPHPDSVMSKASKGHGFDAEAAAQATASSPLTRSLRGRHLQMIAIGGSIGTGLFVASGAVLSTGGPASVLISYLLIGMMLYCTVHALGELAVLFPVAGSFATFSTRFIDPAWGFAMGWNYVIQWLVVLPLEIVAASITIEFWTNGSINSDAWVVIFLLVIVIINLFGVRGYGEAEFILAIIKVIAIIGYILLGIILVVGGGPHGSYIGGKYWHHPGAFNNGFKGLCSVFVNAAFAFGGTELVGLAAAETANPRRTLPTAIKQVFWRIALFYIISLTIVGLLVPYTNKNLLNSSGANTKASPFVLSIQNAGISGLPSVMNVVIMLAVISVGNSAVYGASRTMAALAAQGLAPGFLGYIDRAGRPIVAVAISIAIGFLCFLAGSSKQDLAFDWMLALSGLSSIFTWGSICFSHIRFRRAWKLQGRSVDELAFRSQAGLIGSWFGFGFNCLVLIAQFWVGVWPVGYGAMSKSDRASGFFQAYLAAPFVIVFYVGYKAWYRPSFVRAKDIDVTTGIREFNLAELVAEDRAERAQWPRWKRVYKLFC